MNLEASTATALTRRLAVEQSTQRLPSVVAGIVRGGELVWSGAAGTIDGRRSGPAPSTDTQYRIGSRQRRAGIGLGRGARTRLADVES